MADEPANNGMSAANEPPAVFVDDFLTLSAFRALKQNPIGFGNGPDRV
jgi:hypothetical protein